MQQMLAMVVLGEGSEGMYFLSFNFSAFGNVSIRSPCDICVCRGLCFEGGVAGAPLPHLTVQVHQTDSPSTWVPRPPPSTPPGAWLCLLPLADESDSPTSKAQRFQMQNTSPEKAVRKAIHFGNCFLAELATHCVVMVGGDLEQPELWEEVNAP